MIRTLGSLAASLVLVAQAAPPVKPPAPSPVAKATPAPAVIEGVVLGPDGKPTKNVMLVAVPDSPRRGRALIARSDSEGRFRFPPAEGATFTLGADAQGLAVVVLEKVRPGTPVRLRLQAGGTIEGVVRDGSSGGPATGARAEARGARSATVATSDAPDFGVRRAIADRNGAYKITGLATEPHEISAWLRGVGRGAKDTVLPGGRADLILIAGSSVLGIVLDADGRPVEGASVQFYSAKPFGGMGTRRVATASDGTFIAGGLPPGDYTIEVRKAKHSPSVAEVNVPVNGEATVDVRLSRAVTVVGRLVGENDRPTRGSVALLEVDGVALARGRFSIPDVDAGVDGVFTLDNAPAGSSVLEIKAPGYATKRVDVSASRRERRVDLGDVSLEVGLAIRGRVRTKNVGVADALIQGFKRGMGGTQHRADTRAEPDGTFTLAGLETGRYQLFASADGFTSKKAEADAGAEKVELVLDPAGSITGVVVDGAGMPVPAFQAMASAPATDGDESSSTGMDQTPDADGQFLIDGLAEGTYAVSVEALGYTRALVPKVKVAAGATADAGRIRLGPGGRVSGTVTDSDGNPVAGAVVAREEPGYQYYGAYIGSASTDLSGAFELGGLEPGPATLAASHPQFRKGRTTVELDASRPTTDARIVLTQGGRVVGTARRRDGAALAGLFAQVMSSDGDIDFATGPQTSPVAADGSFAIDHVVPGAAQVSLVSGSRGSYTSGAQKSVDVREGETSTVDFVIRDILVSGQVTRSGAPAAGYQLRFASAGSMGMYGFSTGAKEASSATPRYATTTRDDGSYEVLVDEPGPHTVMVASPDSRRMPMQKAEIPDADAFTYNIILGGTSISGTVIDKQTGGPVPRAHVWARSADPEKATSAGSFPQTGADGRFELDVDPGPYTIAAQSETHTGDPVTVDVPGAGLADVQIPLTKGLTISGRVVSARGLGVPGLSVLARSVDGRFNGSSEVLLDGSFRIGGLKTGTYNVSAQAAAAVYGLKARVDAGTTGVTIGPVPNGRVAARVLEADGRPAVGGSVRWTKWEGEAFDTWGGGGVTDIGGQMELEVPSGRVELTAFSSKGGETTAVVDVPANGVVPVEIRLVAPVDK